VTATPGVTAVHGEPVRRRARSTTAVRSTTAILLATAATDDGGPVAALPFLGSTLLGHLVGQIETLGVARIVLITRPGLRAACEGALGRLPDHVEIVSSDDASDDLRCIADVAERTTGRIIVSLADIATHREALAGLLADPRILTGILTTGKRHPWQFRVRSVRGRVLSAASAYHAVGRPNGYFLGVIKIDERHRGDLIRVSRAIAELRSEPLPPGWPDELGRKKSQWHAFLARRALREEQLAAGVENPVIDPDVDLLALPLDADAEAQLRRRLEFARDDVTSLLLVGLVRSGVQINNSYLRRLFWARPLSVADAQFTAERMAEYDEDKVLLDSAVKNSDGFFTTFFVSPYSRYIAKWAARRGWTPNGVTVLSMALGAAAAAAFATGTRSGLVAGAVLLQLAFTFDCVDGQLARYTRQFSALGAWLDGTFDRAKEFLVFAGLAAGSTRGFGDDVWALAGTALALQTVRHMLVFCFAARQHQVMAAAPPLPFENVTDGVAAPPGGVDGADPDGPDAEAEPGEGRVPSVNTPPPSSDRPPVRTAGDALRWVADRAVWLSVALERLPAARWAKKIFNFPIGERFAVISLTAAIWSPRVTLTTMIVWGLTATVYSLTGASLRSVRQ
jgi:phosphatidylglycerophosphate synthase